MTSIETLFADYADHHRTPGNKWCHRFGIPIIMLSLLGMLARVPVWRGDSFTLDLGLILIVLAGVYYLRLHALLGSLMIAVSVLFYLVGARLPMPVNITLFVAGWILQFIGHARYEKRQPAFLRNLTHLLIGPLWLLDSVVPVRRKSARFA